jgi:hypothetical protein
LNVFLLLFHAVVNKIGSDKIVVDISGTDFSVKPQKRERNTSFLGRKKSNYNREQPYD